MPNADTHPPPSSEDEPDDALTADSTFARLWRGFMNARLAVGITLLPLLGALYVFVPAVNIHRLLIGLCVSYLGAIVAVRLFTRPQAPGRAFDPQWVSTIGVDILAFSALQFLQVGGVNYAPLFALPVLMAAALGSILLALGTAAAATLLLLGDAWIQALHAPTEAASRFLQAGLTGIGFFALAFLVNQLSARLAREEAAAERSRRVAQVQSQVNELVIETLADGILVIDMQGRVQAANPAARILLGLAPTAGEALHVLDERPQWLPLAAIAQRTFSHADVQVHEIALEEAGGGTRRIHVRSRLTASQGRRSESLCVMFLEDLREMEARLRTEKLAAMGRMSAAVAHEIRNPLAAIAQANALLEEDLREPALRQLSALVRKNTQRLAQIVDEILDVSHVRHRAVGVPPSLELDAAVAACVSDWALQGRCADRLQLALSVPFARVSFEPDHLRRVLVNLLDNALRYAGQNPDSIRVATRAVEGDTSVAVWSDGAPLDASVQQHLFEPFFSSQSRSSGLGLYICRELCERHGARIAYRRTVAGAGAGSREGNEFVVNFRSGASPLADAASFDTIAV